MLVLSRKVQQKIKVGDDITITIIRIKGQQVRIGIEAPRDIRVMRAELSEPQPVPADDSDQDSDDCVPAPTADQDFSDSADAGELPSDECGESPLGRRLRQRRMPELLCVP